MNTAAKYSNTSKDKFRHDNEKDHVTTTGMKKKKNRSPKNKDEDLFAPVDIIQAADHIVGTETETDSLLGTNYTNSDKLTAIKSEEVVKT